MNENCADDPAPSVADVGREITTVYVACVALLPVVTVPFLDRQSEPIGAANEALVASAARLPSYSVLDGWLPTVRVIRTCSAEASSPD